MTTEKLLQNNPFAESTLFIIVVYNCPVNRSGTFQSLCRELHNIKGNADIFIYDNSAERQSSPAVDHLTIHYHHDPSNSGVSAAYNHGFQQARLLKKKWMLLLDQDTVLPEGLLNDYQKNVLLYPQIQTFVPILADSEGIISPFHFVWGRGIRAKKVTTGLNSLQEFRFINSGLLISTDLYEEVGGYDKRFPLDFSDIAFTERLMVTSPHFVVMNTTCRHSLSAQSDYELETSYVLHRFRIYCRAAKHFRQISHKKISLMFMLLPRTIRLTWMKKDLRFFRVMLNSWR